MQSSSPIYRPNAVTSESPLTALSREHARAVHLIHSAFPDRLAEHLSPYLGETPTCRLHTLGRPTTAASDGWVLPLSVGGQPVGQLAMPASLARTLVSHLLAVPCDGGAAPLGDIERELLERLVPPLLAAYQHAWSACAALPVTRSDGTIPTDYAADYLLHTARGEGVITLRLQLAALQRTLQEAGAGDRAGASQAAMLDALGGCTVPVRALLGSASLTLRELLDLQVGDILCLGRDPAAPIELHVGTQARLRGLVHVEGGRFLVTVAPEGGVHEP
jgi:flagellar motor switch protein FliM